MSSQDHSLIGRLAVHYKLITLDQLAEVTREQGRQGGSKLLGDLLVEKGLLRPPQLAQLLKVQAQVLAKQRAEAAAKTPPGEGAPVSPKDAPRQGPPTAGAPIQGVAGQTASPRAPEAPRAPSSHAAPRAAASIRGAAS